MVKLCVYGEPQGPAHPDLALPNFIRNQLDLIWLDSTQIMYANYTNIRGTEVRFNYLNNKFVNLSDTFHEEL